MWGKVALKLSKCHSLSPTAALNENTDDHSKTLILLTVNSLVINLVITKMCFSALFYFSMLIRWSSLKPWPGIWLRCVPRSCQRYILQLNRCSQSNKAKAQAALIRLVVHLSQALCLLLLLRGRCTAYVIKEPSTRNSKFVSSQIAQKKVSAREILFTSLCWNSDQSMYLCIVFFFVFKELFWWGISACTDSQTKPSFAFVVFKLTVQRWHLLALHHFLSSLNTRLVLNTMPSF